MSPISSEDAEESIDDIIAPEESLFAGNPLLQEPSLVIDDQERIELAEIEELDKLIKYKNDYYDKLHRKVKNLEPQIKMIAIFITDGHDNMSSSTVEECCDKVAEFKNLNGDVIFMSANMNAEEIGQKYGIDRDTCLTVHSSDTNAIQSGFNAIDNLQRSLSAGITNASFSQFDRTSSQGFVQTHNSTPNTLPQLQRATNVVNTLPTLDINANESQFY